MRKATIITFDGRTHEGLASMLGNTGLSVHTLNHFEKGSIDKLKNENTDLFLCYINYGNEEIVDYCLQHSHANQIPIIFVVTELSESLFNKLGDSELAWYIKEPFYEKELKFIIERSLRLLDKESSNSNSEINNQGLKIALETAKFELWEWDFKENRVFRQTTEGANSVIPDDMTHGGFSTFDRFIHPDDREMFREKMSLCWAGKPIHVEFRSIAVEGKNLWFSLHLKPLFDENGNPDRMIGVSQDITERKENEYSQRESEERFRLIAENARDVIWLLDDKAKLLYISPSVERLRGYTPEELMETPVDKVLMPESFQLLNDAFETFFKKYKKGVVPDIRRIFEVEQPCKDGSVVWTEMHINPVLDDEGNFKFFLGISRNIDERKKNEQELEKQRKLLDSIFNLAPTPMLVVNKIGFVENMNNACVKFTGKNMDAVRGLRAGEAFSCINAFNGYGCATNPECNECVFKSSAIETVIKGQGVFNKEGDFTRILPDGSKELRHIFVSTSYIDADEDAKVMYSIYDITENKKAEMAVINSKIEAEEASRAKSEFLANMSHELRTPLNAIMGYSEILQDSHFGYLSEKQKKFADHIHSSGKNLLELINSILDLAKVESGKMELYLEDFQILDTMRNVQNVIAPIARKKHIKLDFSVEPENMSLHADEIKFRQVLYNLLSNAVKFTPENGTINVIAREKDNMTEISVSDTGIGIEKEEIEKLFTPFHQIDSSISRQYQGTGLGLTLVKRFIELHGGNIGVESEPGKGSTFTFTIPLKYENVLARDTEQELSAS